MEKVFIKNRRGLKLAILVEQTPNQKGLAFIIHGLGGHKEQSHIQTFTESFLESDYTVVRLDTTNSFNKSGGNPEDATLTNYYNDLEDVIKWGKSQKWYQEPFVLVGHSLGGISTALYSQKYPNEVKALAPISTVVSGKISLTSPSALEYVEDWKKIGWREWESSTKSGLMKSLPWSHALDRCKYDLLEKVDKLIMPVLMIVGENDESTPPEHQKMLYDKLPGQKEMHIIKDAPHTFEEPKHLKEIKSIMSDWIKKLD